LMMMMMLLNGNLIRRLKGSKGAILVSDLQTQSLFCII
jgi:hypothetical protein